MRFGGIPTFRRDVWVFNSALVGVLALPKSCSTTVIFRLPRSTFVGCNEQFALAQSEKASDENQGLEVRVHV